MPLARILTIAPSRGHSGSGIDRTTSGFSRASTTAASIQPSILCQSLNNGGLRSDVKQIICCSFKNGGRILGRPREFDRDAALAKARDAFWSRGYEGVSMADLVETLGI